MLLTSKLWQSKGFALQQTAVKAVPSHPGHVCVLKNGKLEHAPQDDMEHNPLNPYTFMCRVHSKWSHAILDDEDIKNSCAHYLQLTNSMCPIDQPLPAYATEEQKQYHHQTYQVLCFISIIMPAIIFFVGWNCQFAEGLNAQLDLHPHDPPDIVPPVNPDEDTDDVMSIVPIPYPHIHIVEANLADQIITMLLRKTSTLSKLHQQTLL